MSERIYLRLQYTSDAMKTNQGGKERARRRSHFTELCKKVGVEVIDTVVSLTTGDFVFILKGEIAQINKIQAVLRRSGGFQKIEQEIFVGVDDLVEQEPEISELEKAYMAPDQDEIDRMLLDE